MEAVELGVVWHTFLFHLGNSEWVTLQPVSSYLWQGTCAGSGTRCVRSSAFVAFRNLYHDSEHQVDSPVFFVGGRPCFSCQKRGWSSHLQVRYASRQNFKVGDAHLERSYYSQSVIRRVAQKVQTYLVLALAHNLSTTMYMSRGTTQSQHAVSAAVCLPKEAVIVLVKCEQIRKCVPKKKHSQRPGRCFILSRDTKSSPLKSQNHDTDMPHRNAARYCLQTTQDLSGHRFRYGRHNIYTLGGRIDIILRH